MTTTKTVGTKYAATADLSTVEIAALVRADIKMAVKSGALPVARYSVRTSRSSTSSSVGISVRNLPFATRTTREHIVPVIESWAAEALAVGSALEAILASYNRESSEPESDYYNARFFTSVDVESTYAYADPELVARSRAVAFEMWGAPKCVAATGWDDVEAAS